MSPLDLLSSLRSWWRGRGATADSPEIMEIAARAGGRSIVWYRPVGDTSPGVEVSVTGFLKLLREGRFGDQLIEYRASGDTRWSLAFRDPTLFCGAPLWSDWLARVRQSTNRGNELLIAFACGVAFCGALVKIWS